MKRTHAMNDPFAILSMQTLFPDTIVLHHTANDSPKHQLLSVDAFHKSRGYGKGSKGFHVGYHRLLEKDGTIQATREYTEMGIHAKNHNNHCIGVCLAGDFTKEQPTEEQKKALRRVVQEIMSLFPIPEKSIILHRQIVHTACPGIDLREFLKAPVQNEKSIEKAIERLQKSGGSSIRVHALQRLLRWLKGTA